MKKSGILAILLAGVLAISSATTAMAVPTSHSPNKMLGEQVLHLSMLAEPTTLDFPKSSTVADTEAYNWCMEGLTRCEENYNIVPGIAEKWEMSSDGLNWTFHLRDAKWSDGKPVRAQDFVSGALRTLDPKSEASYAYLLYGIVGAVDYSEGKFEKEMVGIKAVDDKTVRFTLAYPVMYFDFLVSLPYFAPVRQDIIERDGGNYNKEVGSFVTNGPFLLTGWDHNVKLTFEKNKAYWNQSAIGPDKIVAYTIDSHNVEEPMFETGQLDLMLSDYDSENTPLTGATRGSYNGGTSWFLNYNCNNKILKNKNIRKALTLAIDRESLVSKSVYYDSVPAMAFVSKDIIRDLGKTDFRSYKEAYFKDNDIQTAKALLKKGLKELKIKGIPKLEILCGESDVPRYNAETVAAMWKKNLGLGTQIVTVSYDEKSKRVEDKNFQVIVSQYLPDVPDAIDGMDMFVSDSSRNNSAYKNTKFDELMYSADHELDLAKRSKFLHDAEQVLMEDMPVCPLYFEYYSYAIKDYVKGLKRSAFGPDINPIHAYIEGKN